MPKTIKRWSDKFPTLERHPEYRAGFLHGREISGARARGERVLPNQIADEILTCKEFSYGYCDGYVTKEGK